MQPGIVDAFLCVFRATENIAGDAVAVVPVDFCGGGDGRFLALPVQIDNFAVLHGVLLSMLRKGLSPIYTANAPALLHSSIFLESKKQRIEK
jgi:hypothetical protein